MIYENNKINISDHFANEKCMHYITEVYVKIKDYFNINGFNYTPLFYYYLRHTIGKVMYYIDILEKDRNAKFKNYVNTLEKVKAIMNNRPVKQYEITRTPKILLILHLLAGYLVGKLRPKNNQDTEAVFITSKRFWNEKTKTDNEYGNLPKGSGLKHDFLMLNYELNPKSVINHYKDVLTKKNLLFLEPYMTLGTISRTIDDTDTVRKHWNKIKNNKNFQKIFTYKKINYYKIMESLFDGLLENSIYYICTTKNAIEDFTKKKNFNYLFITNEENICSSLFMIYSEKRYKTISLSHEIIYPGCIHGFVKNDEIKKDRKARPLPDMKLVWNDYAKKTLVKKCNYNSRTIEVVGNPKFDKIFKKKFDKNIMKKFGINTTKPIVMYISENRVECADFLKKILDTNRELFLVFKTRGYNDEIWAKKHIKGYKNIKILPPTTKIYDLIEAADIIIATVSTVIIEAMVMRKNIIIYDPQIALPDMPYIDKKLINYVRDENEFNEEFNRLQDTKYAKEQIKRYEKFISDYYRIKNPEEVTVKKVRELIKDVQK